MCVVGDILERRQPPAAMESYHALFESGSRRWVWFQGCRANIPVEGSNNSGAGFHIRAVPRLGNRDCACVNYCSDWYCRRRPRQPVAHKYLHRDGPPCEGARAVEISGALRPAPGTSTSSTPAIDGSMVLKEVCRAWCDAATAETHGHVLGHVTVMRRGAEAPTYYRTSISRPRSFPPPPLNTAAAAPRKLAHSCNNVAARHRRAGESGSSRYPRNPPRTSGDPAPC